jgi:hypothetical protein
VWRRIATVTVDVPSAANLDVYDTKEGLWAPEHGLLEVPKGWELVPSGDAFLTRRVKAAATYWSLWRPRGKGRPHRRLLGILAPSSAVELAKAEAARSELRRAAGRAQGAAYRARKEDSYREELARAVVEFLGFAPEHAALARSIGAQASERAAEVGSGRVGRTKKLAMEERAALAARALIRHLYTDYEEKLLSEVWDDEYLYRSLKANSHVEVDEFLQAHRPPSPAEPPARG